MAEEHNLNVWIKQTQKCLGKHAKSFILDLTLISYNLKPCLLFDYSSLNVEVLEKLLENLHRQLGSAWKFSVVVLGQDLLIANIPRLSVILNNNLNNKAFFLVEVSGNIEKPRKIQEKVESILLNHFADFVSQLELYAAEKSCLYRCDIHVKEQWNLSSIFGFALSYPVIYWFHSHIQHNCLSLEPLRLYKAILSIPSLGNFSNMPFYDFIKSSKNQEKEFYAFSCPEIVLNEDIEKYVEKWRENILKISENLGQIHVLFPNSTVLQNEVML